MKRRTFWAIGGAVLLVVDAATTGCRRDAATASERAPESQNQADGWTTHEDPAGFAVDLPPGWDAASDRTLGRAAIKGRRGERVVVWLLSIEQRLDARGAGVIVQQLARAIDADMPWGAPDLSANTARVSARSRQRDAVTLLTWSRAPNGAALVACSVAAPPDRYQGSLDVFERILGSVRATRGRAATGQRTPERREAARAAHRMVPWADPRENAFTVSVPEGWNVLGGTYRLSATDTRHCVVLSSPDGQLRVTVGDPNIGGFTVPTPTLSQAGLYEGGVQPLSDGTLIAIRSFRTGCQFAQEWVRAVLPRGWNDLRIVASNDRQDLAAAYAQELRAEGLPHAQVSAGEVAFTGNLNGHDVKGYYVVATHVPFPAQGPSWYVYRIYGHLAPIGRQTEAESICQQVLRSWAFNPQWRAQQRQLSANAVQQDNTRSQQIRSRALQAIAEDQRETSDLIARSYWDRQKTYDEVSRRRSNVNLGTVDVVDPVSGTQYKIGYGADHHWMDDRGNLLGTPTDSTPGVGWRKLITLP